MGNSSSNATSLLYDCGDITSFSGSYWTLYKGHKKDQGRKDAVAAIDENLVSIFILPKDMKSNISISVAEVVFPIANKCVQKLKTMNTITPPVDANGTVSNADTFIMLVTEPVIPLSEWLEIRLNNCMDIVQNTTAGNEKSGGVNGLELQLLYNEVLWGFKCILQALLFLHTQVKYCHNHIQAQPCSSSTGGVKGSNGNLINSSCIYVNSLTGMWKLGNLEFCTPIPDPEGASSANPNHADDNNFYNKYIKYLGQISNITARGSVDSVSSDGGTSGSVSRDISSLGYVMLSIYNAIDVFVNTALGNECTRAGKSTSGVPTTLVTTLKKMTSTSAGTSSIGISNILKNCVALKPHISTAAPGALDGTRGESNVNANAMNVIHVMEYLDEIQLKTVPVNEVIGFFNLLLSITGEVTDPNPLIIQAPSDSCIVFSPPSSSLKHTLHTLLTPLTINTKLFPMIGVLFQYCILEYNNRNMRDAYRQAMLVSVSLLCEILNPKLCQPCVKIRETKFIKYILPYYTQLFNISDRVIRTKLLKSLKDVLKLSALDSTNKMAFERLQECINDKQKIECTLNVGITPNSNPNTAMISASVATADGTSSGTTVLQSNSMIDNILSGFNDSNAQMREDTLKGIVPLLPFLTAANLNDKLVGKYLVSMQQCESEASTRTNCIILIGKIAYMMTDAMRQKVLIPCLVKAIKDPFIHCRIAGIRTTNACMNQLMDLSPSVEHSNPSAVPNAMNMVNKLLPVLCTLIMDTNVDLSNVKLNQTTGSVDGNTGNSNFYRDERELAVGCINTILTKITAFHKEVLNPVESAHNAQQQANAAANREKERASQSGSGTSTGSYSSGGLSSVLAATVAAAVAIEPQGTPQKQKHATNAQSTAADTQPNFGKTTIDNAKTNQDSYKPRENTPSVIEKAPSSTDSQSSWWGLSSLNKSLESATGASSVSDTETARTKLPVQHGSSNSLGSHAKSSAPIMAEAVVSHGNANAWDDDDLELGDDDDLDADGAGDGSHIPPKFRPDGEVGKQFETGLDIPGAVPSTVDMDDFLNDPTMKAAPTIAVDSTTANNIASNALGLSVATKPTPSKVAVVTAPSTSGPGLVGNTASAKPSVPVRSGSTATRKIPKVAVVKKIPKVVTKVKSTDEDWSDF